MKRTIKKVAVLGSGIMGSRIACHFANIGIEVLLLDIVPKEPNAEETAKGLTLESKAVRNRIVQASLESTLKSKPSSIYHPSVKNLVKTGNFTDDMQKIADCDWVIEVVVENLEVKKIVFEQVEKYRKPGTLITSNTSGIPIHMMAEGRSDDFKKHFCGTHFFNPPRYLRLLEIIPTPFTDPTIVDFLMQFGDLNLGKTTVLCKDTPAFIANRVGVYSIMSLFHLVKEMGLNVDEVDKLTGPILGRPKSATFRTTDVVGLDTLIKVAKGLEQNCPNDEQKALFKLPPFIAEMETKGMLGDKTKQGFYKKLKTDSGKTEIWSLNLDTLEYQPKSKVKFQTLEAVKTIDSPKLKLPILLQGTDKAGDFYRKVFFGLFSYVSNRIPEITEQIFQIDDALNAGFGWEIGPFEAWDILGVEKTLGIMKQQGFAVAPWVDEMIAKGYKTFFKSENGVKKYYDQKTQSYQTVPGSLNTIFLGNFADKLVWKNSAASIIDIGDDVLNVEFHSKMNSIGGETLGAINKAIEMAENGYKGVVISNEGNNFSAGANLGLVFMMAVEQEYDELDMAVRLFQNTSMRIRYSSVPVVVAPHGLTLGGGCEMSLHADKVVAAAETYIGLVEVGVGLIPGGGGSKEFALRLAEELKDGDIEIPQLRERFLTIGMAKVSTSAREAFDLGIMRDGLDQVVLNQNRKITEAKQAVLQMSDDGYVKPSKKKVRVLGKSGLGAIYAGSNSMFAANYISEHDKKISQKLGFVLCGGDLSIPTLVSEQYLLDLEREAFLSLCGEKKTLERIQSILTTGKPLRN